MNVKGPLPSRKSLENRLSGERTVLIVSALLTIVNIAVFMFQGMDQFLYSISLPYYAVVCGKAKDNNFNPEGWPENGTWTYIGLAVAAVCVIVWIVLWFKTKGHYGWTIAALTLFCVDTVVLLIVGFLVMATPGGIVIDLCIHVWIIYLLTRMLKTSRMLYEVNLVEMGEKLIAEEKAAAEAE